MAEVPDTVDDAIEELSDTPTTEEVFYKTLPFQGREIASAAVSMAAAGGGGGSSSLTLLGPYTVTYAQLDPVSAVFLVALDAGTIIVQPMIFVTTPFTTGGEAVSVKVSDVSEDHQTTLTQALATADENFLWGVQQQNPTPPVLGAVVGPDGGHLLASDGTGGNSAGVADIYCLVKLP